MIHDIEIRNYRCYEHLKITNCQRVNVLVGDSGTGKTTFLEAVFLALAVTPEVAVRYRQTRGAGTMFRGTSRAIEDGLFGGLFHRWDTNKTVSVALGGTGPEARSVIISRNGSAEMMIPFEGPIAEAAVSGSRINFTWIDAMGISHVLRPEIGQDGIKMPAAEEDQPNFFFFSNATTFGSEDTAERFSQLSRAGRGLEFVRLLTADYPWIENLTIEVGAGSASVFASIKGMREKIPLADVSSAINKLVCISATIASRPRSVILIDEIENGIYYKHHEGMWKTLVQFCNAYDSQLFVTTHSRECLEALGRAVGDCPEDVSLWRVERGNSGESPSVLQFAGQDFVAGVEYGQEMR